jgi:hypothetical protein
MVPEVRHDNSARDPARAGKRAIQTVIFTMLLLAATPGHAQPIADELPGGPWYGWQLMAADAAAATLLFAPVSERMGPLARGMGMITLLMDAPIIHMIHGNSRGAALSLARLPFLLLGRFVGSAVGSLTCSQIDCVHAAPVLGAAIGVAPVILYDWVSARRPGRLFYAGTTTGVASRRLPPQRLSGWAPSIVLLAEMF